MEHQVVRYAPAGQTEPEKFAIDRPCSACSGGDPRMEHHDHEPPFRPIPVLPTCKGKNCSCTDGVSHSAECRAEYEETTDPHGVYKSFDFLTKTAEALSEPYKALCLLAIKDYDRGYGGAHHHHAYLGGLAVHVAEVVQYCFAMSDERAVDMEVLLTAAFWHDYDKLAEYELVAGKIETTDYIKLIGHVVGSAIQFMAEAPVDLPKKAAILHCMLSHHGRKEWGSPIEPATVEAWILHAADMLSSRSGAGR